MALSPGQIIQERFRIISEIGSGNFGEVYKAEDLQTQQICAIKRFTFSRTNTAVWNKAQELFRREIDILIKFTPNRKPFMPQYIHHWEECENQQLYLVESFVQGKTLREKLHEEGSLTTKQVIKLLRNVLEFLIFLHSHEVVHRDIKPDNLILRESDESYVIVDFGAAKQEISQLAKFSGTRIYSPGYTPPEQEQRNGFKNSDIYALGMTAIEALTGLRPDEFKDYSINEIIKSHHQAVDIELENLIRILEKMTDENYQIRYQSAQEVLKDLDKTRIISYIATELNISNRIQLPSLIVLITSAITTTVLAFALTRVLVNHQNSGKNKSPEDSAAPSPVVSPSPKPSQTQLLTPSPSPSPKVNCGPFRAQGEICPEE